MQMDGWMVLGDGRREENPFYALFALPFTVVSVLVCFGVILVIIEKRIYGVC